MNYGRGSLSPMTMRAAWYQAARDAYSGKSFTNTVTFAVAGDSACIDDYIEAGFNSSPQGSWSYDSSQVRP